MSLQQSTIDKAPILQASKWIKCPLLIDVEEMNALFNELSPFYIFQISGIIEIGKAEIPLESFLRVYEQYIEALKQGNMPSESSIRHIFSGILTTSSDHLRSVDIGNDKELVRVVKPVIQMQNHRLHYSEQDKQFHSMVLGSDSIMWGIQFSFPQFYQNPETKMPEKVEGSEQYPNTELFKKLQKWVRQHTTPTPFIVDGEVINVPIRLGKQCYSWINSHPQLRSKGLTVKN